MQNQKALFILNSDAASGVYARQHREDIERLVDVIAPPMSAAAAMQRPDLLSQTEVIFSGWGGPVMNAEFLNLATKLKAFFYAAGAIDNLITPRVWERNIAVSSAIHANSLPVAEYTFASIILSLKHSWRLARESHEQRQFVDRDINVQGCYEATVGLVSLGYIGRLVARMLQALDVRVIACDPYLDSASAMEAGIDELVGLDELFRQSHVVSLHTPLNSETAGMVGGKLIGSMRPFATLINTARGDLIRQDEMMDCATKRQDLQFILDVATPEPPDPGSKLWTLPNVVLTPHIAGSSGGELHRMGRCMVDELKRYLSGQPLKWPVAPSKSHAVRATHGRPKLTCTIGPAVTSIDSVNAFAS